MSKREVMYNPRVVSYSALSDWLRCPKYFEYIYVLKKPRTMNAITARGLKFHELAVPLCKMTDPAEVQKLFKGYDQVEIDRAIRYAEYFIDKHIPTVRNVDGKEIETVEFYDKIRLSRGLWFEYHADNIHYCKDGTLRIMDLKTGQYVPEKNQLYEDTQLRAYAYLFIKRLKEAGMPTPIKVQIGWWLWEYSYNIFVDYDFPQDFEDKLQKLAGDVKAARKDDNLPRRANKFCPGCPMFAECHPVETSETFAQCKANAEFWTAKAQEAKAIAFHKMKLIGTKELESEGENKTYFIREKNFTSIDTDDFVKKMDNDLERLKPYIKPTKDDLKELGIECNLIPEKTQLELHVKDTI